MPIATALLAATLALQAWGERGVPVTIHFSDGHGLKAGDALRHRGITVGTIDTVALAPLLDAVIVTVRLQQGAVDLARVGSRFWIVRPQFGIERITGLETLVGARYLAVLPGKGGPQRDFLGLAEAPVAEALAKGGLDIVLEGSHRGSLQPGSPVTYRKIRVGTVLSVGLASDARTVEIRVRVHPAYVPLVRTGTLFWDASGLALDVGLTGVTLHLDTLQALAMGGVAMATPPDAGPIVSTGHRFALHEKASKDWLEWRPALAIGAPALPTGLPAPRPLRATLGWSETRLWTWTGDERRQGWVLAVPGGLLSPADLVSPPADAQQDTAYLEVAGERVPLPEQAPALTDALRLIPLDQPVLGDGAPWPRERQRRARTPEDCVVVADPSAEPLVLAAARLALSGPDTPDIWAIDDAIAFDPDWHGACVVARSDGRLLGLLLVNDDAACVALLP